MLTSRLLVVALVATGVLFVAAPVASVASESCGSADAGRGANDWYACAGTPAIDGTLPTLQGHSSGSTGNGGAVPVSSSSVPTSPNAGFCTYSNTDTVDGTAPPAPRAGGGRWVFVYCGDSGQPGGWSWVAGAGPAAVVFASPAQLARQAYARV